MKRYNMPYVECEDENGEWVRYEDIKILVGKLRGLETKIARIEDGCNCEEKFNDMKERPLLSEAFSIVWFCPAHGYKKL